MTIEGYLGKRTQHYTVFGTDGLIAPLAHCDYKDPDKIVERGKDE